MNSSFWVHSVLNALQAAIVPRSIDSVCNWSVMMKRMRNSPARASSKCLTLSYVVGSQTLGLCLSNFNI